MTKGKQFTSCHLPESNQIWVIEIRQLIWTGPYEYTCRGGGVLFPEILLNIWTFRYYFLFIKIKYRPMLTLMLNMFILQN